MALTQTQLDALAAKTSVGKLAVKIGTTFRFCSGQDAVQVAAQWYTPRPLYGSILSLGSPGASRTSVTIDDTDDVVETAWYADRFSGDPVEVHILLRQVGESSWTLASSVLWDCERCSKESEFFRLDLYAATGTRKRASLVIGNTTLFPRAPREGEVFYFGGGIARMNRTEDHKYSGGTVGTTGFTSSQEWMRLWRLKHPKKKD